MGPKQTTDPGGRSRNREALSTYTQGPNLSQISETVQDSLCVGMPTSAITIQEHGAQLYPKPMANTQTRAHAAQPAAIIHSVHGRL